MTSDYCRIRLDVAPPVATVVLNRPDRLNALDLEVAEEVSDALREIAARDEVRAVVLRGEGRAFSAGGDVREMAGWIERGQPDGFFDEPLRKLHMMILALWNLPKPVIAAVHGFASGAGMSLALASDLRIAAVGTRFNLAFVNLGLAPDSGSTYTLPRLVGLGKAFELALTGNFCDAVEAERLGIVNRVVPAAELVREAEALAGRLAEKSAVAAARLKALLHQTYTSEIVGQLEAEARIQRELGRDSPDFPEGVRAFLEKRPPQFNERKRHTSK
jgi:2-(1,2-epoxy-1,2-dihydrophenyl)acetyl-CoA isomerase